MRKPIALLALILCSVAVLAQNGASSVVATPAEQAEIKPLLDAEVKAANALNAAISQLPEAKAYNAARNNSLDAQFRIMAKHGLSSREYKPELDAKGDLVFVKIVSPKP